MKFTRGARVRVIHEGDVHLGRVTQVEPQFRRVVTDDGHRLRVPVRWLRSPQERVLILETRLNKPLKKHPEREYGPMMKTWLLAYQEVTPVYEKVHTVEDIRGFLRREGRKNGCRIIQLMCHGYKDEDGRATLGLTLDDNVDLMEHVDMFDGLHGRVILFSCCDIGKCKDVLETIRTVSGAAAVIGYRAGIWDFFGNICDVLLYDRLLKGVTPATAVSQVAKALDAAGIRNNYEREAVMVCCSGK